jgi:hypothetical protein
MYTTTPSLMIDMGKGVGLVNFFPSLALISASQVAGITGASHHALSTFFK